MTSEWAGPSRAWYWVGGAAGLLGVIGAIVLCVVAVVRMADRIDGLQHVSVPGQQTVTFTGSGGYVVYLEARGGNDARTALLSFNISMEPLGGGPAVAFSDYSGSSTYALGGHEGRAALTFEITNPGPYNVETATGSRQRLGQVALGRTVWDGLGVTIVLAVVVLLLGWAVGAAIVAVTAVRRHRVHRAQGPGSAPPTPQQYPYTQPYPAPYPAAPYPGAPYPAAPYPAAPYPTAPYPTGPYPTGPYPTAPPPPPPQDPPGPPPPG